MTNSPPYQLIKLDGPANPDLPGASSRSWSPIENHPHQEEGTSVEVMSCEWQLSEGRTEGLQ